MKKIQRQLLYGKKEHKLILCFFTIVITSITLFLAINALPLLEESIKQDLRQTTVGKSEYIVTHKQNELFQLDLSNDAEILDVLALNGKVVSNKNIRVSVWGVIYDEFLDLFGDTYAEKGEVEYPKKLSKNSVIISPEISEKLNLKSGDQITLNLYENEIKVNIMIAPKDNYFVKANSDLVLIDKSVVQDLLELEEDDITVAYIHNVSQGYDVAKEVEKKNKSLFVDESINKEYVSSNMTTYYGIDFIIFLFILLVTIDILKSSGLIYVIEKSHFIGCLRSNGAEKKSIKLMFGKISLFIAILGTGLGMILGSILVCLFSVASMGNMSIKNMFDPLFLCTSIVFLMIVMNLISFFSFRWPVNNLLKKSDRALILEDSSADIVIEKNRKFDYIYIFLLGIFIIGAYWIGDFSVIPIVVYTILLIFCLIKSCKSIFKIICNYIRQKVGKGTWLISLKNIAANIYLRKSLSLTTAISLFIIIIGILVFSVLSAMTSFYKDYRADAYVKVEDGKGFSKNEKSELLDLNGVDQIYIYHTGKVSVVKNKEERKVKVTSLDEIINYDKDFMNLHLEWLEGFKAEEFGKNDNVILSEALINRFKYSLGDEITLNDGTMEKKYKLVGKTPSLQELGDAIYISSSDNTFCEGSKYNVLYIKGTNLEHVEEGVDSIFLEREYSFRDVSEMKSNDITNGMQIIVFFISFAMLIFFTSMAGIFANYKLSYLVRKKETAILFSNGYHRKNIVSIFIKEITVISLLGYSMGVIVIFLVKKPLENLMNLIDMPIEVAINPGILLSLFVVVFVMMSLNTILAFKASKIKSDEIIEILKK